MKYSMFFVAAILGSVTLVGCSNNLSGGATANASNNSSSLIQGTPNLDLNFAIDSYLVNNISYSGISNFITAAKGSFSRSSTATYFDNTGTLQTAAANQPRLDHDGNGNPKGLLIEASSTNLLIYSSIYNNGNWNISPSLTLTSNAGLAPDGTMTATEISASGSGLSYFTQTLGSMAGLTITRSAFVKPGTTSTVVMEFIDSTNCANNCEAIFNVSTLSSSWVLSKTGEGALGIQKLAGGWYRVYATFSYSANGTSSDSFYIGAYGAGVGTIYVWGMQLENQATVTSYIPTTSAAVTRSADGFSFPAGTWYNSNAGTVFTSSYGQSASGCTLGGDGGLCFAGFNKSLSIMTSVSSGSSTTLSGTDSASLLAFVNMALAWDQTSSTESQAMSYGQSSSTSYTGDWATTNFYPGGSNSNPINASILRVTYYPIRQSSTALVNWP